MKTAEEYWEETEKKLIEKIGLKHMTEEKVYFPNEVWKFMEEYASLRTSKLEELVGLLERLVPLEGQYFPLTRKDIANGKQLRQQISELRKELNLKT